MEFKNYFTYAPSYINVGDDGVIVSLSTINYLAFLKGFPSVVYT